ncbi:MAG: DUF192 domain-containing protein [Dehalococcoidia bacterium]|nr:DUF192 domain-containing protein [Dehalococcoidia bacterium]
MNTRPCTLVLAPLAALALLAAACGGGSPSSATPPPAQAPRADVEASATATASASAPAEPTATTGALPLERLGVIEFLRADGVAVPLRVEVPPRAEYGIGLSGRYALGERGMLFHYDDPHTRVAFWMKNTRVDLAIAFVDGSFRVVEIREMQAESLEIITPQQDYQYAVEAPARWYERNGIRAGDQVRLRFSLRSD